MLPTGAAALVEEDVVRLTWSMLVGIANRRIVTSASAKIRKIKTALPKTNSSLRQIKIPMVAVVVDTAVVILADEVRPSPKKTQAPNTSKRNGRSKGYIWFRES